MYPRQRIGKITGKTMIHLFPSSCIDVFFSMNPFKAYPMKS